MSRPTRSSSQNKEPLFTSLKDRLGALLLLSGLGIYWLISWNLGRSGTAVTELDRKSFEKAVSSSSPKTKREAPIFKAPSKNQASAYRPFKVWTKQEVKKTIPKGPLIISLNFADSAGWESLPGIGPVLASRIIKYKDRLGGFHSTGQLREVYGLADSVFEQIIPRVLSDSQGIRKIDINMAGIEELRRHPYLNWQSAKAIVRYREAHGLFENIDQLKDIWNLPPETIEKISYYLTIVPTGSK